MAHFSEVLQIVNGRNQKTVENPTGKYPIYGSGGIMGYADSYLCGPDTVIIGRKGNINNPIYVEKPFWNVDTAFGLVANQEKLLPKYLYYFCVNFDFEKLNTTVTIPSLTKANLLKIEIPLPPLSEQRRIAAILDKVDSLTALRQQQLDKLDELVKARFVEMFGQNRAILENWESIQLDDIADVGSSKRVFVSELKSEGIPFYRGTEIGALAEGKEILPDLYITEDHYASLVKITGAPQPGDLLLPSICYDGRIWLVDTTVPFYFKDGRVLWIHPKDKRVRSTYLQYSLKEKIVKDYLKLASGTTFSELKIFTLKSLQITLPPREMQIEFEIFVDKIKKIERSVNYGLTTLCALKASLMQQYFS